MKLYNLGIACGNAGDATNFYRATGPLGALRNITNGLTMTRMTEVHWAALKMMDGVFMHRPYTPDHLALCRMVKAHRKPLWIDHDDNLFEVGLDNPVFQEYASNNIKEAIAEMLTLADVVTVSTPFLAEIYSRFAKKVIVIPNAFDDDIIDPNATPKETKPIVFWRGSNTHQKDWASVGDGYVEVASKHPEWQYAFMGYHPWHIIEPLVRNMGPDKLINVGGADIMRYFDIIKQVAPKLMIVPLFEGVFNYAKSNIAWMEGTYAGSVVLAPNWPEWQKPGAINYETKGEAWKNFAAKLESMLVMPEEERVSLQKQSWKYIQDNLMLSKINYQRRAVLNNFMGLN